MTHTAYQVTYQIPGEKARVWGSYWYRSQAESVLQRESNREYNSYGTMSVSRRMSEYPARVLARWEVQLFEISYTPVPGCQCGSCEQSPTP